MHRRGSFSWIEKAYGIALRSQLEVGGIGLLRVRGHGRLWEPSHGQEGADAIIVPVYSEPQWTTMHAYQAADEANGRAWPDPIDVLALHPSQPNRWAVRSGFGQVLGAWELDSVRDATPLWRSPKDPMPPAVRLFEHPLDWLRSGCAGACILHEVWAAHVLSGIRSEVIADSERYARNLDHILTVRPTNIPTVRWHAEDMAA